MSQCSIRFYEELNDFLPPERRKVCFSHDFQRRASIKDMIEAWKALLPQIIDGPAGDVMFDGHRPGA